MGREVMIKKIFGGLAILFLIGLFSGEQKSGASSSGTASSNATSTKPVSFVQSIRNEVAQDAVAQYRIAEAGSAIDRCVQAGIVAAAFLQAKNESKYIYWKTTEESECKQAGLPR